MVCRKNPTHPSGEIPLIFQQKTDLGPSLLSLSWGQKGETDMKTVYIVDDSMLIRGRLMEMFSGLRDTRVVGVTGDPVDALQGITRLRPDIVVLDIQLPGRNGIELLKDLMQAGIKTHVVILTGSAYPQYRKECLEAGAELFLNKVKDFERLPSIIDSLKPIAQKEGRAHHDRDGPP
jgi:CheY-like chemotaxis protein